MLQWVLHCRHLRNSKDNAIVRVIRHHHKHQGLDPLIRSVSRVTAARANAISPVLPLDNLSWVGCPQDG